MGVLSSVRMVCVSVCLSGVVFVGSSVLLFICIFDNDVDVCVVRCFCQIDDDVFCWFGDFYVLYVCYVGCGKDGGVVDVLVDVVLFLCVGLEMVLCGCDYGFGFGAWVVIEYDVQWVMDDVCGLYGQMVSQWVDVFIV